MAHQCIVFPAEDLPDCVEQFRLEKSCTSQVKMGFDV